MGVGKRDEGAVATPTGKDLCHPRRGEPGCPPTGAPSEQRHLCEFRRLVHWVPRGSAQRSPQFLLWSISTWTGDCLLFTLT